MGRLSMFGLGLFFAMSWAPVADAAERDDIGGAFQLVNQDGVKTNDKAFLGKPTLLYFGFTTCPDICPVDLAKMAWLAKGIEGRTGQSVNLVFVTIDPQRDTPARLKGYVSVFSRNFVGLTGSEQQIAAIADKYHVYYKKVPYGEQSGYMMDHSTFLFLLGADGAYLEHYGRAVAQEQVLSRALVSLGKSQQPGATQAAVNRLPAAANK